MSVAVVLQVPPEVLSVRVVALPAQTCKVPPGVAGIGLTVTVVAVRHPVGNTYSTVTVSGAIPRSLPVLSTVAIAELVVTQLPPIVVSDKAVEPPTQTEPEPEMVDGKALKVKVMTAEHVQHVAVVVLMAATLNNNQDK